MKRLNITIDEETYEKVRAYAFIKKISISKVIRESLKIILNNKENEEIKLSEEEERRFINILKNDEFLSLEKVKKELDL